ncbi:hypothetical protein [Granulicoccus phenolivorans]|uniref:hypothetical protein n=1 Tax=Granulicoccus phenolivorans TaxID=266854 RepID=UPI000427CDB0|nr:hypothetical protein [Granulicoccus phenolivorans]
MSQQPAPGPIAPEGPAAQVPAGAAGNGPAGAAAGVSAHRALGSILGTTLREVFVVPIQDGRIRTRGWSRGLAVVAAVALLAYLGAMLTVLGARLLGDVAPIGTGGLRMGLAGGLALLTMLPVLLTLGYLAALQLRWYLRLPLQAIVFAIAGSPTVLTLVAIVPYARGVLLGFVLSVPAVLVVLLVGAFALVGRPLRVWVGLAALAAMGWIVLVPILLVSVLFAGDVGAVSMSVALTSVLIFVLAVLAVPTAYAAGASFIQISVNTATWTLSEIRHWVRPGIWPLLAILLLAGNLALLAADGFAGPTYLKAVLWTAATLLVARVWLVRARRFGPWDVPRPTTMAESLMKASGALGLAMSVWLVVALLPVPGRLRNPVAMGFAAVLALVLAERAARRGSTAAATVLAPVAVSLAGMGLMFGLGVTGTPHRQISGLLTLVLLALGLWWRRRGPLTAQQWFLLAIGAGILLIFPERELLAEPLSALLGFSTLGVLIAGLLWRLLTEGEWANVDGRRFNRTARVLVFCGYALVTACAAVLMAYAPDFGWDLDSFASIGSQILGVGVAAAIVVGIAEMGRFGLDPAPPPQRIATGAGVPPMSGIPADAPAPRRALVD